MSTLRVRKLGYALGAEISGVDLARPLGDATIAEIRQVWLDNIVICFRGQRLEPRQFMEFCRRFGPLNDMRRSPQDRHPDYTELALLSNLPAGGFPAGGEWHSDQQFTDHPGSGSFLFALDLPDIGGDTMFVNMYMAYETLSPKLKSLLQGLEGVHDLTWMKNFTLKSAAVQENQRRLNPPVVHPVVRVHPETGRKSLFLGAGLRNFVGMTTEESQPLIDFLSDHSIRYEFMYRHRWSLSDLLLWDNRCAMHRVAADYDKTQLRRMLRCALLTPQSGHFLDDIQAAPSSA